MKNNKLYLNIDDGKSIVVERLDWHDEFPNEFVVYICNKEGIVLQDICLVRQHYENGSEGAAKADSRIDCMVWADCEGEDYTHKFVIDQWKYNEEEL